MAGIEAVTVSDWDVYRSARLLIDQHGDEAPKRLRFCEEHLVDLNATAAYVRAGYSENGAAQAAYMLLRNAYILAAIERLEAAKARRMEVTQDTVLREACENLTKPNIQAAIAADQAERGTARRPLGKSLTSY